MKYSKILGFGHYLPPKVMTNFDFEKMVDTNDEWIRTRTGIEKRHFTGEGETASTMAVKAAENAIKRSGIEKDEIDLIIIGTVTSDMRYPSTATLVQKELGLKNSIPALDIAAACSGFVYGATIADAFIKSGIYKTVLVIGSENLSKFTDMQDRNTCVLFGDGAGAAIIQISDEPGILSHDLSSDGKYGHLIEFPAGGSKMPATEESVRNRLHYTRMEGQETYKQAVRNMSSAATKALSKTEYSVDEVAWVIPHQANIRIIESVAKRLKVSMDKVFTNIATVGNTSAASIPIALSEMQDKDLLKKGDIVVLSALGSGLTWGAMVLKW